MKDTEQIVIYSRKSKFTGKGESIENQIENGPSHGRRCIKLFLYGDKVNFHTIQLFDQLRKVPNITADSVKPILPCELKTNPTTSGK